MQLRFQKGGHAHGDLGCRTSSFAVWGVGLKGCSLVLEGGGHPH